MRLSAKLFLWGAVFAVLGVLALWIEHARAAARTRDFKAQLEAKGERLSYTNHVPPMPPMASNGATAFAGAANALTTLNPSFVPQPMRLVAPGRARVAWRLPALPEPKEADVWPAVAAHIEENRDVLAELHAAVELPVMVHKLAYEKTFSMLLPHLQKLKGAVGSLSWAALYDMREGNREAAFTNLLAGIRAGSRLKEPVVISQLIRVSCGSIMFGTTWEAMQFPGWTDRELAALQQAWEEFDTLEGYMSALNMERAMGVAITAECRTNWRALSGTRLGGSSGPGNVGDYVSEVWSVVTWHAWTSYADERWLLERHQISLDGARLALATNCFAPVKSQVAAATTALGEPDFNYLVSKATVPAMDRFFLRIARHETTRRLAAAAIALERHKLRHGRYPEALAALVPEFMATLPHDFMDGNPLRYRLLPEGTFLLWSIGDDLVDDGGDGSTPPAATPGERLWINGRDLVWPLPGTAREVEDDRAAMESRRPGR